MPLVKFISPTDPKWLSTLNALTASLVSDSLVYRYNPPSSPDEVRGAEGTFSACSCWYVEALARAERLDQARLAFEEMLNYANHLGLYAEQISRAGQQQGNSPQALTHLALISARSTSTVPCAHESPGSGDDRSPGRRRGSVRRERLAWPRGCARQYAKIRVSGEPG